MQSTGNDDHSLTQQKWFVDIVEELFPAEKTNYLARVLQSDDVIPRASGLEYVNLELTETPSAAMLQAALPNWLSVRERRATFSIVQTDTAAHAGALVEQVAILWLNKLAGPVTSRLLIMPMDLIKLMLSNVFPDAKLTSAEIRVMVQLSIGYTLKTAASEDHSAYETKRSQLKTVLAKTGLKRQAEVASVVLANLLVTFTRNVQHQQSDKRHRAFHHFVENCLPSGVRSQILVDDDGTQRRLLDVGSVTGHPVILLPHLGVASLSEEELQLISSLDLRLIVPLRNGAIGPQDQPLVFNDHMADAIKGITLARKSFCNSKAVIASAMSSGFYAARYLSENPQNISDLIFIGASFRSRLSPLTPAGFRNILAKAALNNPWLLGKLIHYLSAKTNNDPNKIKEIFLKTYADSPADLAVIEREFASAAMQYSFVYRMSNSLHSIPHDIYLQAEQDWSYLNVKGNHALHFIHGTEDKVHPIETLSELTASLPNTTIYPVHGAGSMICHEHGPDWIRAIDQIVRR